MLSAFALRLPRKTENFFLHARNLGRFPPNAYAGQQDLCSPHSSHHLIYILYFV